jgi:hypothetical protein
MNIRKVLGHLARQKWRPNRFRGKSKSQTINPQGSLKDFKSQRPVPRFLSLVIDVYLGFAFWDLDFPATAVAGYTCATGSGANASVAAAGELKRCCK